MKLSEAIHHYADFVKEVEDNNLSVSLLSLRFKNVDSEMERLIVLNTIDIEEAMNAEDFEIVCEEMKVSKL